jgi:hypothetical protein
MNRAILSALTAGFVISAIAAFGACSDDTASTSTQQPAFTPGVGNGVGGPSTSGSTPDAGGSTATSGGPSTSGGCPNTPAGCFCGTPTTQAQWLNRCTTAAALPVSLTVKPATTADIP